MVHVLANGEVVSDDDSRIRNTRDRRPNAPTPPAPNQQPTGRDPSDIVSQYWAALNNMLRGFGINSVHIAGYTVEPGHMLLALLALIFMGVMGVIVVLILITATQDRGAESSQQQSRQPQSYQNPFAQPPEAYRGAPRTSNTPTTPKNDSKSVFGGTGQRLGS